MEKMNQLAIELVKASDGGISFSDALEEVIAANKKATAPAEPPKPVPAVPVEESIQDDYIVCLEDGKKMKLLRRYLKTHHGMTPQEYREKWGLPADYPMVAPAYAARRSELAKEAGLGTRPEV